MKLSRRHGRIRLRLDAVEVAVLRSLLEELVTVFDADQLEVGDPVRQRLFPAGYTDDDAAAGEFRDLTESALRSERTGRARACLEQLATAGTEISIDGDDGERWLQVLNDIRLALGTRLDIREDDDVDIDLDDPDNQQRAIYYWLTAMQDSLVRALMG